MKFDNILIEINEAVARVTINRPKALNALNVETLQDLLVAFESLASDTGVKVVIITGIGEKAFCAGGDIAHMNTLEPVQARNFAKLGQKVLNYIEKINKPVIAAVNGYALGGGCELAMACDIRLASENARIALPEVTLGVIPGFGGTQRLSRLVGRGRAKELVFTGDTIDSQEAYRIGLVNRVVTLPELLDVAQSMAGRIASRAAVAVSFCKDAINNGSEMDIDRALAYEADLFSLCFTTGEQAEGMGAFLEKRPANF